MIYFKSINHENKDSGYCYLHDVKHVQYPKKERLLNVKAKDLLYTEKDDRDEAYIEVHGTLYKEKQFKQLAESTAEKRYCILTQMVTHEAHTITHVVRMTGDKVCSSARETEETPFVFAIKGEVVAYLDPIKLGVRKNLSHSYTEYHLAGAGKKGLTAWDYLSSYTPDHGAVQKVMRFPLERLLSDLAQHQNYTVLSSL
jgi:hypothetical protein